MQKEELLFNKNTKSLFSESIKTIKTNLDFIFLKNDTSQLLLITSPESGDGKSFIVANLAASYAQYDKKVLIIDGDLRRGRQHILFNVESTLKKGYSNLILNYKEKEKDKTKVKLNEYILKTEIENVFLLRNGMVPPNPVELLDSENNKRLLKDLRKLYDIIILDSPPVLGLSDTLILSKYSDVNIFVVSSNKTNINSLDNAKKAFDKVGQKISGVILNKSKIQTNKYNSYYTDNK